MAATEHLGITERDYNPYDREQPIFHYMDGIAAVREHAPFFRSTFAPGFWVLTRFDLIREAYQNPELFSSRAMVAIEPDPPYRWVPIMLDPPLHTAWRHLLGPLFTPARARAMEPEIRSRCVALIDDLVGRGSCDFVADFALKYPTSIFMEIMGLPVEEADRFMVWEEAILRSDASEREDALLAMGEVCAYFADLVDDRRANPRDDLVSTALTWSFDGAPIEEDDLLSMCLLLFMAGLDTVTAQLGYSWLHLATNDADRNRIVDDPAVIPDAIEELLRRYAIV